jgi:hypothetical protein
VINFCKHTSQTEKVVVGGRLKVVGVVSSIVVEGLLVEENGELVVTMRLLPNVESTVTNESLIVLTVTVVNVPSASKQKQVPVVEVLVELLVEVVEDVEVEAEDDVEVDDEVLVLDEEDELVDEEEDVEVELDEDDDEVVDVDVDVEVDVDVLVLVLVEVDVEVTVVISTQAMSVSSLQTPFEHCMVNTSSCWSTAIGWPAENLGAKPA